MKRTIDSKGGTMQYGAAGTRNLATDLTKSGCDDKDDTQTTADKLEIQPTTLDVEMIRERPRNDENNLIHLEETLEELTTQRNQKPGKTNHGRSTNTSDQRRTE